MKRIEKISISGKEVWPIIEGGKGVGITNGYTSGAFAAAGAVGTFSGVHSPLINEHGEIIPMVLNGKTRYERTRERIEYTIKGIMSQLRIASEISGGEGRIHMNLLWGLMGTDEIIERVLPMAEGKLHGVTCGAGMPYQLGDICAANKTYYYPIVSSMRAFMVLWKRAYHRTADWLGGVVYEDPWKAGGHNGLSNKENPLNPEAPYARVKALRDFMNKVGLQHVPIVMAGGVWNLNEYQDWIDNPELGKIVFQLGTRPLLTKESPIPPAFKQKLLSLREDNVVLNKFSPTGFYSSAIRNDFLDEHYDRSSRQLPFSEEKNEEFDTEFQKFFIKGTDVAQAAMWDEAGYTVVRRTPDNTLLFLSPEKAKEIQKDQKDCSGCLAACAFSSWSANPDTKYNTGIRPDPRSFCIMKTLQYLVDDEDTENQLMFAGHSAFRFQKDPLYANGNIPSTQELVDKILAFE
ncbi:2-nitropropane dioxygenase (plasmid) [Fulvitalea axinellae]|uniref:2-nitropropane dioxygenase n=1 Tax=Fulvitalea axinellae TaxID=1182444 RepID=A0AAU9DEG8_9BACT|nr:2-nitropropane dioxygenase [Fulvitalea axinellae]